MKGQIQCQKFKNQNVCQEFYCSYRFLLQLLQVIWGKSGTNSNVNEILVFFVVQYKWDGVFWILKHIIALLCFIMFMCSCYAKSLLMFLLILGFLCLVGEQNFFLCFVFVRMVTMIIVSTNLGAHDIFDLSLINANMITSEHLKSWLNVQQVIRV